MASVSTTHGGHTVSNFCPAVIHLLPRAACSDEPCSTPSDGATICSFRALSPCRCWPDFRSPSASRCCRLMAAYRIPAQLRVTQPPIRPELPAPSEQTGSAGHTRPAHQKRAADPNRSAAFFHSGRRMCRVETHALNGTTCWRWKPSFSICSVITSPERRYSGGFRAAPTPGGVPVVTTSPGSNTMNSVM